MTMGENIDKVPRRSKVEIETIDEIILDKLLQGHTPLTIIRFLMENYSMSERNSRMRIDVVNKRILNSDKSGVDEKISRYKEMYADLYQRALDMDDIRTAGTILQSMTKLEGLEKIKIEQNISGEINHKIDKITIEIVQNGTKD